MFESRIYSILYLVGHCLGFFFFWFFTLGESIRDVFILCVGEKH